jgi:hypothetical protein
MNVSTLKSVHIRQAFPHEAHNLTVWLETNINALSDRLGIQLTVIAREKAVGSFSVDLLCEDSAGNRVIIENQLERSDHDHLGKLLTYLVNLEAKKAIWVTTEPRIEHQRVIDWLNENTSVDIEFYLVKIEAVRIGDSPYAPLFTILARPDAQIREIGETKKDLAEHHYRYGEFWTDFLAKNKNRSTVPSSAKPANHYWLSTGAGKKGLLIGYGIFKEFAWIELYIDVGDRAKNKAIFDGFQADAEAIEREFGQPLDWQRGDGKHASRIAYRINDYGGLTTPENWDVLQEAMINSMIRFDAVFRPRVAKVQI